MAYTTSAIESFRAAQRARYPAAVERIEERTESDPNSGCWLWAGLCARGYGYIKFHGKAYRAHRFAYQVFRGDIPQGQFVCHKCDTPLCVNPDHLFLGTPRDNVRDMYNKGRNRALGGTDSPFAKLDAATVLEIVRRLGAGERPFRVSADLGISSATISQIGRGKTWSSVTGISLKPRTRALSRREAARRDADQAA